MSARSAADGDRRGTDQEEIDALVESRVVRVHLVMCRRCRRNVRELARIGEAARALKRKAAESTERGDAMVRRAHRESGRPPR